MKLNNVLFTLATLLAGVRMLSRKERCGAEHDAAKRKPGRAGSEVAAGATGAAAAAGAAAAGAAAPPSNLDLDPGGGWTTQDEDPEVLLESLGARVAKQRADAGDMAAQYSRGRLLLAVSSDSSVEAGRSLRALVGLALCALRCSPARDASRVT